MDEKEINARFNSVMTHLGIAARAYPIKALAKKLENERDGGVKGESTLYNELNGQKGFKLGLKTAIMIMHHTGNLTPLDEIEKLFNRVAYKLPDPKAGKHSQLIRNLGHILKESGELSEKVAAALEDGVIDRAEIDVLIKEVRDVLDAGAEMNHVLLCLKKKGKNS